MVRRQLVTGAFMTMVLVLLLGVAYPLVVTGIAQVAMPDAANGSILHRESKAVGSSLIGQSFLAKDGSPLRRYFQSRPSAAGDGYDGLASSGSNLGPGNPDLLEAIKQRVADYRALNGLALSIKVPADAVTASGSGLDPHISVANARLQAPRVAKERGIDVAEVVRLVNDHTTGRSLGIFGERTVNVVELNLALDARART